jgi:TrmH family RNA methyltransferase
MGLIFEGNAGTIIRTAAGLGFSRVLLTRESVNPWSPKVVRSAMGGHFNINITDDVDFDAKFAEKLITKKTMFVIADSKGNSDHSTSVSKIGECLLDKTASFNDLILIVGNESTGINSDKVEMLSKLDAQLVRLNIPLENAVESLNCSIAFAIIGHELKKFVFKS